MEFLSSQEEQRLKQEAPWKFDYRLGAPPLFLARKQLMPVSFTTEEGGEWKRWHGGAIPTKWLSEWPGKAIRKKMERAVLSKRRNGFTCPWSLREFCPPSAEFDGVSFHSLVFSDRGYQCYWDSLNGFRHRQWWLLIHKKFLAKLRKWQIKYYQ
jgi:hypothetical protein